MEFLLDSVYYLYNYYVMINLIVSRCSTHGLFLYFILLHISNSSVSASLVGHVLYSVDVRGHLG